MRFTESHEWIRIEGDIGTVGITEHARKELGEIVFVELPIVGKIVRAAEAAAVLESTKAASDVYAPLTGIITAVNENLQVSCSPINHSPENEGWLFKLKIDNPGDADMLMDGAEYTQTTSEESWDACRGKK